MSYALASKSVVISVTFRKLNVETTFLISKRDESMHLPPAILYSKLIEKLQMNTGFFLCLFFLITPASTIPFEEKRLFHVQKLYFVTITTIILKNN